MLGTNTLCYLLYLYSEGSMLCVALCNNVYFFNRRNAQSQNLARAVGVNVVLVYSLLLNFALGFQ